MNGILKAAGRYFLLVALECVAAKPMEQAIKTELSIAKIRFRADEPIMVDVYVENQTKENIERNHFSPLSSLIRLPEFVLARVPDGKEFAIPPGLYGDDWDQWYQPASGKEAFFIGRFALPPGKKIHLLHGDLRLTVLRAREHCQRELDEKLLLERPENATTKKSYQEIVRFADDFLKGGIFDFCVRAYSQSQTVQIEIAPIDKKKFPPVAPPDRQSPRGGHG